ncbi:MAG: arabinosylfuranosidase ArfA [Lacisediminihabitans sp.]
MRRDVLDTKRNWIPMTTASVFAHPQFAIAPVQRRIFGSFVEHMGRCVYEGIYEPGHSTSDTRGFRGDVLELARELGVSVIRYPGGNFVSGFRWEDSVGPVGERPRRLDLAWRATDTNEFGLHEFMEWVGEVGAEPLIAVNLGTRGTQEALDLLEYSNYASGTTWAEKRIANGAADPFDIRLWCLGNEMDGPWQLGQKSADEYGRLAAQTAKAMKRFDKDLALVACGSSHRVMPTFGAWEATVLSHTYEYVNYISLHAYYDPGASNTQTFLCSAADMDAFITSVVATADHIAAVNRSDKKLQLSFDEWNVAPHTEGNDEESPLEWTDAPRHLAEVEYTVNDAVVVGSLLMTLLNHSDRVGIACQAQLANVLAPIRTDASGAAWRQTIFYPFALMARHAHGDVLDLRINSPVVDTELYGQAACVIASATVDRGSGAISVFLVNRDESRQIETSVDLSGFGPLEVVEQLAIHDDDPHASNTRDDPHRVTPHRSSSAVVDRGRFTISLPPASWHLVRLSPAIS